MPKVIFICQIIFCFTLLKKKTKKLDSVFIQALMENILISIYLSQIKYHNVVMWSQQKERTIISLKNSSFQYSLANKNNYISPLDYSDYRLSCWTLLVFKALKSKPWWSRRACCWSFNVPRDKISERWRNSSPKVTEVWVRKHFQNDQLFLSSLLCTKT